jgi:large subunit ribosomal protein L9
MKIILKEDDVRLGNVGDIVSVSPGYGRNFLLPQKRALLASEANVNSIKNIIGAKASKLKKQQAELQQISDKINGKEIEFTVSTSTTGQMFGSVTNDMIATEIKAKFDVDVDKRKIAQSTHIKSAGTYIAKVKVFSGIDAEISIKVIADQKEEVSKKVKKRAVPQDELKKA